MESLTALVHVRLDRETLKALAASARQNERTVSQEGRLAFRAWLESRPGGDHRSDQARNTSLKRTAAPSPPGPAAP